MLGGDLRCTSHFRPQTPDPFTPAIFDHVSSPYAARLHIQRRCGPLLRSGTLVRPHLPSRTPYHPQVNLGAPVLFSPPFLPIYHLSSTSYMLMPYRDNQGHKAGQYSPRCGRPCSSDRFQCSVPLFGHETACISGRLNGLHCTRSDFASRVYIHP